MGIAPVFWAAFSDFYNIRRFLLIISMIIFVISSLGNAVITNIWGMVVLRCVQAIGASSGQAIGGGVIGNALFIKHIHTKQKRRCSLLIFFLY